MAFVDVLVRFEPVTQLGSNDVRNLVEVAGQQPADTRECDLDVGSCTVGGTERRQRELELAHSRLDSRAQGRTARRISSVFVLGGHRVAAEHEPSHSFLGPPEGEYIARVSERVRPNLSINGDSSPRRWRRC